MLVDGLSPFLEIAPKGKDGANRDLKDRLDFVQKIDEVVSIGEPVDKWLAVSLGLLHHWPTIYLKGERLGFQQFLRNHLKL